MLPTLPATTITTTPDDPNSEVARLVQVDVVPFLAYGIAANYSISAVPPLQILLQPLAELRKSAKLTFSASKLQQFVQNMRESRAIGLREMTLGQEDVDALRRHREHPTARPRLPLRAVPTEEVDKLY